MRTHDAQTASSVAPPPGITLTRNGDDVRIIIRTAVSTLWKLIFLLSPFASLICLGLVASLLGRHVRHRRLFDPLLFAEIPALLCLLLSAFATLCWVVTTFVRQRIIWNRRDFRVENVPRWLRIPTSEILAFRAVEDSEDLVREVDFSDNALNPIRRVPRTGLEINVPAGRIRVLDGIGVARARWLANELNTLANLAAPASPPAGEDLVAYAASSGPPKPVALGFVLIGIAISVLVLPDLVPGLRSLSWPSVTGRMTNSSFVIHGARQSPSYRADVGYGYSVNGKQYVGSNVAFAFSPTDDPEVRQLIHAHPKGASISVYYNPDHPEQSVLVPGVSGIIAFLGVASAFAAIVCILCIYPILKRRTPTTAQAALVKRYAVRPPRKARSYPVMP